MTNIIKRIVPGIRYILTGNCTLSPESQKALEVFIESGNVMPMNGEPDGMSNSVFNLWSAVYSTTYPHLSKSFHKRFSDQQKDILGNDPRYQGFYDTCRKGKTAFWPGQTPDP